MVKIERLPSGSYRARVHLGGGKYKSITGKDKKAVQLEAAQYEADIEAAQAKENDPHRGMTVGEAIDRYIDTKRNVLSPTTLREYTQTARNNFADIRDVPLYALTPAQVQAEVNKLAAANAPKTVRNKYGVLSSSLAMFRPDFVCRVTLPQKTKSSIIIPTEDDMMALFRETYDTSMEIPVLLGSISGMRASEIIGLRWSAVDLNKGTARIKEAKVLDQNREYVVKGTKTRAGTRTIRLLPHVCDALRRHYDPAQEYVVPLTYAQVYDRYQKALERCCPGKHYTFHELRHYACSVMIWMGMPVKYIADYLGHETENMVNQVYGHIMADKKDAMFDKLAQYYDGVFKSASFEISDTKSDTNSD